MKMFAGKTIYSFTPTFINEGIDAWSRNWISYTGYAAVMLTAEEFRTAPSDVASAISRYIETGGTIILAGNYIPGRGYAKDNSDNTYNSSIDVYYKGFGSLLVFKNEESAENWEKNEWGILASHWQKTSLPFKYQSNRSRSSVASSMPVVEDNQIPVKSLFLVVLIFAILVGPVNLFLLARKEKTNEDILDCAAGLYCCYCDYCFGIAVI